MEEINNFVKEWNRQRKADKNNWIVMGGQVCGLTVHVKSYGCWVQRIKIYRGDQLVICAEGSMAANVKAVSDWLRGLLNKVVSV